MREGLALLLLDLILLLQSTCFSSRARHPEGGPESLDVATPPGDDAFLDTLVRPGVDMVATFNLELLEDLHQRNLECHINFSSAAMKYSKRMNKFIAYHRSMEKLISIPEFSEFSHEDRSDVEANFHRALQHMEQTRNKELKKIRTRCNSTIQDLLTEKFTAAVSYAKKLFSSDRQQYRELMAEMTSYKAKMRRHLATCQHSEHGFDLMYCYVEELETMLYQIDRFLEVMENNAMMYYGDDEDLSGDQGSGVEEVDASSGVPDTTQTPPSPTPTKIPTIKLPPGFFGVGPVIISPPSDATNGQTTPTQQVHTPERVSSADPSPSPPTTSEAASQQSTPTSQAEVSVSRSPPQPLTAGDATEIPPATSPHSQTVPIWLDTAFEDVLSLRDQTPEPMGEEDEGDSRPRDGSKTAKRRPSQQPRPSRPGNKVPRPLDIEVQGSYDGHQVDFSAEVGGDRVEEDHAHARPVVENVILDPEPHQDDDSTISYILTFFFLTLGVIIVAFSIMIITIVCCRRRRRRRGQKVNSPVLSEKDMLEVMKKSGYVNPTYKFYTQS